MDKGKEKIVKEAVAQGATTITILEGKAPAKPDELANEPVNISGTIDAPLRFLEKRKNNFDMLRAFAKVFKGQRVIQLVLNEQSTYDKYTVEGYFRKSSKFDELKINTGEGYIPEKLAQVLKLRRSIFPQVSDHAKIVSTLRKLKAKINRKVEEANDDKGNRASVFEQTVESNMPESFKMKMPLFEGEKDVEFEVAVVLSVDGQGIQCHLESVDAAEMMDEIVNQRFDEQIEKLEEHLLVIEA